MTSLHATLNFVNCLIIRLSTNLPIFFQLFPDTGDCHFAIHFQDSCIVFGIYSFVRYVCISIFSHSNHFLHSGLKNLFIRK